MKLGNILITNIKDHVRKEYEQGNASNAYTAYRALTGASITDSWKIVKPWIREWEGEK